MREPKSVDTIYLTDEGLWLRKGGNSPWSWLNEYGDIKKIHEDSSVVVVQFSGGFELEIPRNHCWLGYEVGRGREGDEK